MKCRPWGELEALLPGRQSMEKQYRAFHQKRFFTLLWLMQATLEEPGACNYFAYKCSRVWQASSPGRDFLVQRLQEPPCNASCMQMAAQIKMKHCMLVFVFSMDTSAQHINYVIPSTYLHPVGRPVPAKKNVKIFEAVPKKRKVIK